MTLPAPPSLPQTRAAPFPFPLCSPPPAPRRNVATSPTAAWHHVNSFGRLLLKTPPCTCAGYKRPGAGSRGVVGLLCEERWGLPLPDTAGSTQLQRPLYKTQLKDRSGNFILGLGLCSWLLQALYWILDKALTSCFLPCLSLEQRVITPRTLISVRGKEKTLLEGNFLPACLLVALWKHMCALQHQSTWC